MKTKPIREYYVVTVVIGGTILSSGAMLLGAAEVLVKDILNAAENTAPQIIYSHSVE